MTTIELPTHIELANNNSFHKDFLLSDERTDTSVTDALHCQLHQGIHKYYFKATRNLAPSKEYPQIFHPTTDAST